MEADLERVHRWGATHVVTLIKDSLSIFSV
jgi:hypothetical protein